MSYRRKLFQFLSLSTDLNLGLRTEGQTVGGDAPYYLYPFVEIRGIANKCNQGQHAVVEEAEVNRWLCNRWHLLGFAGSGKAFVDNKLKGDVGFAYADWRTTIGLGFRYEITHKLGL